MGQSVPYRPKALVVEDDEMQRELVVALLEECEIEVIQCESAEAAQEVLKKIGAFVSFLFTDVQLAGRMTGAELATFAQWRYPGIHILVTSGKPAPQLPDEVTFMPKPWIALDILREAEKSVRASRH
jgi:CheY-like chemotaxis protein